MGVHLSRPHSEVTIESGKLEEEEGGLRFAVGEMQGWRKNMEDAHIACLDITSAVDSNLLANIPPNDMNKISVFAVFDGHGGKEVAKFSKLKYINELVKLSEFQESNYEDALLKSFHRIDELLEQDENLDLLREFRALPNPSDKEQRQKKKKTDDSSSQLSTDVDGAVDSVGPAENLPQAPTNPQRMEELIRQLLFERGLAPSSALVRMVADEVAVDDTEAEPLAATTDTDTDTDTATSITSNTANATNPATEVIAVPALSSDDDNLVDAIIKSEESEGDSSARNDFFHSILNNASSNNYVDDDDDDDDDDDCFAEDEDIIADFIDDLDEEVEEEAAQADDQFDPWADTLNDLNISLEDEIVFEFSKAQRAEDLMDNSGIDNDNSNHSNSNSSVDNNRTAEAVVNDSADDRSIPEAEPAAAIIAHHPPQPVLSSNISSKNNHNNNSNSNNNNSNSNSIAVNPFASASSSSLSIMNSSTYHSDAAAGAFVQKFFTVTAKGPCCTLPPHRLTAGCTAIVALKVGSTLYVANAGDSRGVLCRGDDSAFALSEDHKPMDVREFNRIREAGGFVTREGRINGNLNLSRSLGDLKYKQNKNLPKARQMIAAEPDILKVALAPDDKFIILACDGIWDCLTNQQACDFVRTNLELGLSETKIVKKMCRHCLSEDPNRLSGIGTDNMTCLIVLLQPSYKIETNDDHNNIDDINDINDNNNQTTDNNINQGESGIFNNSCGGENTSTATTEGAQDDVLAL